MSASSPRNVLAKSLQPSWQAARTAGENAKQARPIATQNKPDRKSERLIDLLNSSVIIFLFLFVVEAGMSDCINCNPVPRGTRNHPRRDFFQKAASLRLTRGSSWIWRSR